MVENKLFIWDSTFLESITIQEKHKYYTFDKRQFNYEKFREGKTYYDKDLPYFSSLIDVCVLAKYIDLLRGRLDHFVKESHAINELYDGITDKSDFEEADSFSNDAVAKCKTKGNKTKRRTFEPSPVLLENLEYITKAANEWHLFTKENLTEDDLKRFFDCEQGGSLQPKVNNYVIYLLNKLAEEGLISKHWQAAIYNNHMLLSSSGNGTYLNQTNISSVREKMKQEQSLPIYRRINKLVNKIQK